MNANPIKICSRKREKSIQTGLKFIDKHGGIPAHEITEICGKPGVGKTFLLHQIAFNFVRSGTNKFAILFDIDKSFSSEKIIKLCSIFEEDCESILNRILVHQFSNDEIVIKAIQSIPHRLQGDFLIIVDSVPNLFVSNLLYEEEENWPDEYLYRIIRFGSLLRKALKFATIVTSNQVRAIPQAVTKRTDYFWRDEGVRPALGHIWEEFIDNRLYIKKIRRDLRVIVIVFSSGLPETFGLIKFFGDHFE